MLTTNAYGFTLIVRTHRGASRFEVLADGQSLACSAEAHDTVADAVYSGLAAAVDQMLIAYGVKMLAA